MTVRVEAVRVVEHWWNGNWGRLFRRDLKLREDDGRWSLWVRRGEHELVLDFRDEADARTELALLLAEHGPWTQLSGR